jgi:cell cycle serine/threonine-protein kinase CDC5/MSD2
VTSLRWRTTTECYFWSIGPSSGATTPVSGPAKVNGFDAAAETLCAAFDALAQHQLFRDPSDDVNLPEERVFIASWVDYCNKYGMGYALTDGSVGVHFNDSTTLVLAADKQSVVRRLLFSWDAN